MEVGHLRAGEGFVLYLPAGEYSFWLGFGTQKAVGKNFNVVGGETATYKWDKTGDKPYEVSSLPTNVKILASGSLMTAYQIKTLINEALVAKKPKFEISYEEPINGKVLLKISAVNAWDMTSIYINGVDKAAILTKKDIESVEKVNVGRNDFEIKMVNKSGFETVKSITIAVLSEKEKKEIAEEARKEKARLEKERLAQKLEEERIAKEGDGTTEDLLCKKYGLKPLTNGYAECRMRLDFAKAESQKKQEQYEKEKAEYDRQVAAIQKEREKQRAMRQLELGLRMMGGQSPIDAVNSVGTGAPIAPSRPTPINQTITMPNGRMINCTTFGTNTNCF
jgi:hypothetical protein